MARTKDILTLVGHYYSSNERSTLAIAAIFTKLVRSVLLHSIYLIVTGLIVLADVKFHTDYCYYKLGFFIGIVLIHISIVCRTTFNMASAIDKNIRETIKFSDDMDEQITDNIQSTMFHLALPSLVTHAKTLMQPLYYEDQVRTAQRIINMQYFILGIVYVIPLLMKVGH